MSLFDSVNPAPPIEVFQLGRDYQADTSPDKVSLGVGAYRTEEGKPWILPVVKKAEKILAEKIEQEVINHEYLPVLGLESFATAATAMLLGEDSPALAETRAFGVQVKFQTKVYHSSLLADLELKRNWSFKKWCRIS